MHNRTLRAQISFCPTLAQPRCTRLTIDVKFKYRGEAERLIKEGMYGALERTANEFQCKPDLPNRVGQRLRGRALGSRSEGWADNEVDVWRAIGLAKLRRSGILANEMTDKRPHTTMSRGNMHPPIAPAVDRFPAPARNPRTTSRKAGNVNSALVRPNHPL